MRVSRKTTLVFLPALVISISLGFLMADEARAAETAVVDSDGDGLSDVRETTVYFTDPLKADTDGDGFDDAGELTNGYSPRQGNRARLLDLDSDKDGLNDGWELALGTGLMNPDTDGDSHKDGEEVRSGYDPTDAAGVRLEKVIRVDADAHRLTYYLGDRMLETFLISAGKPATPTPRGEFKILQKLPVVRYVGRGYNYPNTKWNMLFTRQNGHGYYIHGAYWHSKWGRGVSGGCVNVQYSRMERLYAWADVGTRVVVD
jgi:hypothetical protein